MEIRESPDVDPADVPREWLGHPSAQILLAALPGRYPLAVTKYRESELHSSSLFNQHDPWDPPVVFEEFLQNNENIEEEVLAPPSFCPSPRLELCPVPSRDLCQRHLAVWTASSVVPRPAHSL